MASRLLNSHWMVSTAAATGCWALSDVCCDCCIGVAEESSDAKSVEKRMQLSPEQNAMISAWVSLAACLVLLGLLGVEEVSGGSRRDATVALAAGAVHFLAYAVELRAYRTASSTVITPLLQLSAVWMTLLRAATPLVMSALPSDDNRYFLRGKVVLKNKVERRLLVRYNAEADVDALYVATAAMRPAHLFAVFLVFVGGFLPAAGGKISRFADPAFYAQEAVQCCVLGEFLVCVYNALLHMCTFRQALVGDPEEEASVLGGEDSSFFESSSFSATGRSEVEVDASRSDVLRFFAISRLGTFLAMVCLLFLGRGGISTRELFHLRNCDRLYLVIAFVGECLSVAGVCIVMFSYATFHEPAVVNAAEGGVQQILNLAFAIALKQLLPAMGRPVEHKKTKLLSFLLVSAGLALSCR